MSTLLRFSRSPFYVRIQPSVVGTVSTSTTEVFIWDGLLTAIPAANYTIRKTPIGNSNLIILDLAQLVNDYLEVTYNGTYSTDTYYLFSSTIFYDAANVQIGAVVELPEKYRTNFIYLQIVGVVSLVALLWGSTAKDRGQSTLSISKADRTKSLKVSYEAYRKLGRD